MSESKHILLGVTGSIATYKSAELVRLMKIREWNVTVIMTRAAERFVGELTFRTLSQNPVQCDMFKRGKEWCPEHIELADRADVLVIAPCTANVIAKIAHGIADDSISCTALATTAPIIVAPAMNVNMLNNPATQANLEILKSRGTRIIDAGSGELACGYTGHGRMADIEQIMHILEQVLNESGS